MKILACCFYHITEFFLHPGYTSAHVPPRYPRPRPRPQAPEPLPEGASDAALGGGGGGEIASVGDGVVGALQTGGGEALATPATSEGFFLDMFMGADRWTALLIGVFLFFITAAMISVMRGRKIRFDDEPDPLANARMSPASSER